MSLILSERIPYGLFETKDVAQWYSSCEAHREALDSNRNTK